MSLLPEAVNARRLSSKTRSIAAAGPSPVDLLTYYFPSFPFLLSFQTKFVWQNSLLDLFLLLSWCCCPSLFLFFPHPFFSHSCWSPVSSVRVVGVFVTRNPSTTRQETDFTWGRPAAWALSDSGEATYYSMCGREPACLLPVPPQFITDTNLMPWTGVIQSLQRQGRPRNRGSISGKGKRLGFSIYLGSCWMSPGGSLAGGIEADLWNWSLTSIWCRI